MEKEKPRLARLTAILTQLQSRRMVTAREIADKHGISIRTVYRDIRTLEKSGVPVLTEEGKGYYMMDGYKLPPVMFTEEEANALITAEQMMVKAKDKSLASEYQSAITKIRSVLKASQKEKTELLSERIHIRTKAGNGKTSTHLIELQSAVTNYQIVHLAYTSLQGKKSLREIEPFALYSTNENWLLIAFCRLRNDFRSFRLDCITKITVSTTRFEPHDFTLQQYFEQCIEKLLPTPDIPMTQPGSTFAINQKNSTMQKVEIKPFHLIGISVRTSNQDNQALTAIGDLWKKFMAEDVRNAIPNKLEDPVYSVYTNYESDHTQPYDVILGCKVSSLEQIPDGMVGVSFEGGTYVPFVAKGDLTKGAVYQSWVEIWNTDLDRKYTADFEVYGQRSLNTSDAEVDIFIAVNE
ncbi:WYL domain-containing protein [Fulvivirga sp. M361]|uniref:effector binding domain-containing protein n=1 Tax=Fulvivirga sp. M361 TaxID=2594266 RepID=UPI001179901C|nr:WYL domain-containing protein [Fulvivirga sp. M361]